MSDAPRLLGPEGKPVSSQKEAASAQVQPGPRNRFRGVYLTIPMNIYNQLAASHKFLASIERAPTDFSEYLIVLMMNGANVFIPHQMAEHQADVDEQKSREARVQAAKWAEETLANPDASIEDKKKAHDIRAALEMDRQAAEQAAGDGAALHQADATPVAATKDERERNLIVNEVDAQAAQEAERERVAKATLQAALDATPPSPGEAKGE